MNANIANNIKNLFGLEGKTAIVTGAAGGIGQATAKLLAELGANVIACDIEAEALARTVSGIAAEGGAITAVACDITSDVDIKKTVDKALEVYGTIDILVNNAAGCGGGVTVDGMSDTEWARLIELNLTAVYKFTMAVLPTMRRNKRGTVCSVSSGAAVIGEPTDVHYSAAKGGVISMMKGLARELGHEGLTFNVVAPGVILTRMAPRWEEEMKDNIIPRVGQPKDVAGTIAFLVSDAASYFTGQVLCPNGGSWM